MGKPLSDNSLDQLFRTARTRRGWTEEETPEVLIRATYDLAKIAPYAVNVQLKMEISRKGAAKGVSEPSDVKRVIQIMRDANYQGWFTLEFETKENPFVRVPEICDMLRPLLA